MVHNFHIFMTHELIIHHTMRIAPKRYFTITKQYDQSDFE